MNNDYLTIAIHILSAALAGGLVGLERSFHGRPAGFRTHTLVCAASALLMLIPVFEGKWLSAAPHINVTTDPTRMAQGIMTGIGFLGAGVIYKEGATVRGLTTAASIWMTAALGILFGIGFYYAAMFDTLLTLGVLSVFRWIETKLPVQSYAHFQISFGRDNRIPEQELRSLLEQHNFSVANMSYRITNSGSDFEYRMIIRTTDPRNPPKLAERLSQIPAVREFRIMPSGVDSRY